jgi:membrane associated rhomboid family serine protease
MFPLRDNIPLARFPIVTVALVAINVVVYLLEIRHGGSLFGGPTDTVAVRYGAIPYELTHPGSHCGLVSVQTTQGLASTVVCQGQPGVTGSPPPGQPATWETAFTSMFLHGSFLHIFGNMLFLAIFGPTIEDSMGRMRFVVFYLLGGLVALGAQVLVDPNSTTPTLGASGAIAAVLGGYIVLYPRARILSLVLVIFFATIVEVPAVVLLGFWFVVQLYFGAAGLASPVGSGEGVAYFAHVGGFAFGLVLIRLFVKGRWRKPTLEPTRSVHRADHPRDTDYPSEADYPREADYPSEANYPREADHPRDPDRPSAANFPRRAEYPHEADDPTRTR